MIERRPDWERHLVAAIENTPGFAWGEADCCTFAARIVLAMTGQDLLAVFRGRYQTARGALRFIRQGGGLELLISQRLGPPLPRVAQARRGDIVLARTLEGEPTVAICAGDKLAAQGMAGAVFLPLAAGVAAWSV
jgi:hypothetical protein